MSPRLPRCHGLGQTATVGPAFFGMSPVNQVKHLGPSMATANHGISAGFRTKYVNAIKRDPHTQKFRYHSKRNDFRHRPAFETWP
jgi:hypothetical protein